MGWFLLVAVLTAVAWLIISRPTPVKTVRPERGELVAEVFGTGTLEAKVVVGVSSKIIGKVVEVLVDQGDTVTDGQTLARLEDKDFRDAVQVATAQRNQAEAVLAKAKVDFERQRPLLAKNFVSQADFDAYETGARVAEAQLKTAVATLGVVQAKLADTHITSPASGLVITRNLEVGSTVVPGAPIFRVAASTPWVAAQVDERATGELRLGQPARVAFETTLSLGVAGQVARLSAEVDRVTEEREVDITLGHLPDNLFLGQRADVYIETARKGDALRIPLAVLVLQESRAGVFAVVDGRARWRPVQLGLRGRNFVEILHGVSEQDVLIVSPLAGKTPITDDAPVTVAANREAQ
ncbi:MAG: efflux RND transporter periplasmic adaptor subunit [Deltaproteobacteria bacterium]|nr:efflux RND transporter periplasmic adaptor subunit [Deltaproteobacteria bacterium]